MGCPEVISNEDLWERTNQQPIKQQIKERKWQQIGHMLKKTNGGSERSALG
jgi:hypothetical protein